MGFLLIDETEELEWELPDQTGDGKPAKFFYSRIPHDDVRAITLEHCGAEADERKWSRAQSDARDRACILKGWKRGEGWFIQRAGGVLEPVTVDAAMACRMPYAVRVTIARAIRGEIYREKVPGAPPPETAKADPLGNSAAT